MLLTVSWNRAPGPGEGLLRPRIILWAWERPEDLRRIDPQTVGVAYLAATLLLRQETVAVRPRLQPLYVPPATALMPVVRLEVDTASPPTFQVSQRARIVAELVAIRQAARSPALQIDFDARVSARAFYRALLHDLRRALPDTIRLSITALASWCLGDPWLTDVPIDEAVPMLFRLGVDRQHVRGHLQAGGALRCLTPQQSLGIATDEPLPRVPSGQRLYIFSPHAWSPETLRTAMEEAQRWP
jgi:hypothetical protein